MKTSKPYTVFGITVPEGAECRTTDSCAVLVTYDESKGFRQDTRDAKYRKMKNGDNIAVPWSITDEAARERVVDEYRYQ